MGVQRFLWSRAWQAHAALLPLLHLGDPCCPENTCVNLQVLWNKALAGNCGLTDDELARAMLPASSRWLIGRPLCWLYPRFHHALIAERTRYIDAAIADAALQPSDCVVSLGAGFDTRALRYSGSWVEIDLPDVAGQKRCISERLLRNSPSLAGRAPRLVAADLASADGLDALRDALCASGAARVVVIIEALLIYLPHDACRALLRECATGASLIIFTDQLPAVPYGADDEAEQAVSLLADCGLELVPHSWRTKRGFARHMGVARPSCKQKMT